jgi:Tfp pilus assembly protein PilN
MVMQINLAPDLKQERLKIKRGRQLTVTVVVLVLITAVALPIVLSVYRGTQAIVLNRTKSTIEEHKQTLAAEPELSNMLTVQKNLTALPDLYSQRNHYSQMFDLLPSVIPIEARLTNLEMSADGTLTFTGTVPNHALVEKFYAALRFSGISEQDRKNPEATGNFSNVMLESVSSESSSESNVSFVLMAQFNPDIIKENQDDEAQE